VETLYWNEGYTPFITFSQIHKVVFGWSWRRGLIPPPLIVVLSEAKDLPYWEGVKSLFPTDRILVVLSEAKDLRLISPKKRFFYCVISNEVRNLRIQSKGVKVPLSNLPQNNHNPSSRSFEGDLFTPSSG